MNHPRTKARKTRVSSWAAWLLAVTLVASSGGCSLRALFQAMSDSYSEGGLSQQEKQAHFDAEMERWEGYEHE